MTNAARRSVSRAAILATASAAIFAMAAACLAQASRPASTRPAASRPAASQPAAAARPPTPPKTTGPVTVLDTQSVWRNFPALKPPVIAFDDGLKPLVSGKQWLDRETPAAPAGWTKPEFSDASWMRGGAREFPRTAYLADLCARAKFEVTDPAAVKDLKLSVTFYGGAIVYLNGEEIARAHLPKDAKGPETLAEAYGPEAYLTEQGKMVGAGGMGEAGKKAMEARNRKLTDVAIPAAALRKGVNVLAIEVVRAPYHKLLADKKNQTQNKEVRDQNCPYDFCWFPCELRDVSLTAAGPAGLVPNAARPAEWQAWNSALLETDTAADFGDRCDPLRPVTIRGARNGWASGKVVLGSPKPIEGLKVTCGALSLVSPAGEKASIPAERVRARFAVPYGARSNAICESLLEAPLETFGSAGKPAVVPVWITVKVPRDALAGTYAGPVTLEAKGERPLAAEVRLEVADFVVPEPHDYRTWVELMQSPDTLAAEYNVPLWSEKHWDLIAQSMRYIGEIGSQVVHIPLIAQTNSGNEQSMVRFLPKADGTYDYDFTIMDRYLDVATKYMGSPKFVAFTAWEIYLDTPKGEVTLTEDEKAHANEFKSMEKSWAAARWELRGKGPAVTALDPKTKELSTIRLPRFDDANSNVKAIWKPLFDELHKRMAARGLEKNMLLGMASDRWASKPELTVLQEVSGNLPWINHTHGGSHVGSKLSGIAPVAYTAFVWNVQYAQSEKDNAGTTKNVGAGSLLGWKRPELYAEFRRSVGLNDWPPATLLLFPELQITGGQRGVGRIGADFWQSVRNKRGDRAGRVWDRYPQSLWHSCNMWSHLLLPGPQGPVASMRYEQFREGVQECEARIAIEAALTDEALKGKLGADFADQCQRLLNDRIWEELKAFSDLQLTGRTYATSANNWGYGCGGQAGDLWYAASGWQERTQKLYDLAGEVARKLRKP